MVSPFQGLGRTIGLLTQGGVPHFVGSLALAYRVRPLRGEEVCPGEAVSGWGFNV